MSSVLIQQYLAELAKLRQVGGTHRESVVREAFKDLLKGWGRALDLTFVPEYEIESPAKERRYVDGALVYGLRLPFGYWEAKDERDDLDAEIELKFKRGYPQDNIVFEDSREAVLIQNRREVIRCAVDDVEKLQRLLELYFGYERPEIAEFRKAVEQFKADLPAVCDALRGMIERAYSDNATFRAAADKFLKQARETINPSLGEADVREILIQHILTEEIFALVFPGSNYHEDNNIARELYKLEHTFFTGNTKHQTLRALEPYYAAIRRSAGQIASHHEKQTFLKVVYENFYKVYNPKAADRLGVVYTPNEIVRFMIESADWLCEKHFGRNLIDRDVEILDPAAGTGTFISELLEHFRGQPAKLKHKYLEELHANEVAILPYYVANLNIEATYAAISGEYLEYPNLCFVDTLDNVAGLRRYTGQQVADLFGMGEENVERIKRQNRRKISVVIGNPPYNANQANENDNNKNREYPDIDARIKDTYIKASTAQKTKLYDMYARFFRWASDRVAENGVVAFISNRSYIDSRTFDGFRDVVAREFSEIHIVDLGGDVRANPKLSGTKHNVFGIQTGVAIGFLVKRAKAQGCRIFYSRRPEFETAEEKLAWLSKARFDQVERSEIRPDAKHNWLNLTDNDFDSLIPLIDKRTKARTKGASGAIFKLFGNGINTARDQWVTDTDVNRLRKKAEFFLTEFARYGRDDKKFSGPIKWSRNLKNKLVRGMHESFDPGHIHRYAYRPYFDVYGYLSPLMIDELGQFAAFNVDGNVTLNFPAGKEFRCLATRLPSDFHYVGDTKVVGLLRREDGQVIDNITDWALKQFRDHYGTAPPPQPSPAGGGSKSIQPSPAGRGSKSSQPPSAGGRGESIQPPPAGEGSKSSQPPSAGGRGEGIQPPPAGEGSSTTQPIPPGRGREARILRAATATISKSSPVMDGSEAQSHSGGGSAGFDSLPQRGRVGEGEPQASTLFIPKPLPASLKARARELRGNLTDAEKLVWSMLRKEQMGVKFRRQHPVDPYVLDFYCVERKLAVEIDGGQHNEVKGREHDERRTIFLQDKGIRVLRFWNNEVSENPEGVWDAIVEALKGAPPPQPSPAGGGGESIQPSPAGGGSKADERSGGGGESIQPSPAGGGSKADERSGGESEVQSPGNERGFYSLPQRGRAGVGEGRRTRMIDKQDIFHYVYAVLHDPVYREKYAQNLKREFPRIPFYPDFWRWAEWGKTLMGLHIGYESVQPWPLARTDIPDEKARKNGASPKAMLKTDKDNGRIVLDTETTLAGIPREAWDYKLGNRSALEWILDQYKEKKPKDPTIRERFNTYRFADYKDKVIDLLARVTRVSVETQTIVEAMRAAPRTS